MKTNSKNLLKKRPDDLSDELSELFDSPPSIGEKEWHLIHQFYHMVLTQMERNEMTQADLAKKLKKSRSAISQMLNKTPNITVKKMVELAEAVGIELDLTSEQVPMIVNERTDCIFTLVGLDSNITDVSD